MATKKEEKDALGAQIDRKIKEAVGVYTSTLSNERERLLRYYDGELPARTDIGSSAYVYRAVYDGVEAMRSQLEEVFSAGSDIIRFSPLGPNDVEPARIATEYCSYQFWQLNPGRKIVSTLIFDGLMARVGVVKVYWLSDPEYEEREFSDLDLETVNALDAHPDVMDMTAVLDEETGTYSGTLKKKAGDNSRAVVENVAPEEFGVEPEAKSLEDAFHYHRVLMSKSAIIKRWPEAKKAIENMRADGTEYDAENTEKQTRFRQIEAGKSPESDERKWWVYECYMKCADEDGDECLHKIVRVGGVTLEKQEVDRSPFKIFTPLPKAHSFWGHSFGRLLVPAQNSISMLQRSIEDHATITTAPRYTVLQGGLMKASELLRPEKGGIVNITKENAVQPLPQAPLNPFVFQTIELHQAQAEQTTGISRTTQGLNKDVFSKQNSSDLVQQMVQLEGIRQRGPARELGETLKEIFIEVNRLVVENADRKDIIDVAGAFVEVDPRLWAKRKIAEVTLHLSPGDRELQAMKRVQFFTQARQDPALSQMIQPHNAYRFAVDAAEAIGIRNISDYLTPPERIPPKGPSAQEMMAKAQLDLQSRQIDVQEASVQTQAEKVRMEYEIKQLKAEHDRMMLELKAAKDERDLARKELETISRVDIANREMHVVETAPDTKGIASPGM